MSERVCCDHPAATLSMNNNYYYYFAQQVLYFIIYFALRRYIPVYNYTNNNEKQEAKLENQTRERERNKIIFSENLHFYNLFSNKKKLNNDIVPNFKPESIPIFRLFSPETFRLNNNIILFNRYISTDADVMRREESVIDAHNSSC